MIELAAAHAAATFVATVLVVILNLKACAGFGYGQLIPIFSGYSIIAIIGLGVWAILAVRRRQPWIAVVGIAAAAPALFFIAHALANPDQYCL